MKPLRQIHNSFCIEEIGSCQRDQRANEADHHALNDKRARIIKFVAPIRRMIWHSCLRNAAATEMVLLIKKQGYCQKHTDDQGRQHTDHTVKARKTGDR